MQDITLDYWCISHCTLWHYTSKGSRDRIWSAGRAAHDLLLLPAAVPGQKPTCTGMVADRGTGTAAIP